MVFYLKFSTCKGLYDLVVSAPTQSPSYSESPSGGSGSGAGGPGNSGSGGPNGPGGNLPLSMDPVLAVVSNSTGHQVKKMT